MVYLVATLTQVIVPIDYLLRIATTNQRIIENLYHSPINKKSLTNSLFLPVDPFFKVA